MSPSEQTIWKVPLADLDYGEEEEQAVLGVLQRRWLTMGAETQAFEQEFSAMLNSHPQFRGGVSNLENILDEADATEVKSEGRAGSLPYTIAVSNATEALHLACLVTGLGPGDDVIVPSLTFVASANAVLYTGANVLFADIVSEDDLTVDVASISALITPQTKAILVMHYAGFPCQMEKILKLAHEKGLVVIEDAAHAPGAWLNGKHLGTLGDVGCFSFFSNKNLSTGEGGMLVTNRHDLAEKIRLMRSHGMTSLTWDRHRGHAYTYDVIELGYNYRIDEIRSALGRVQLKKLLRNNQRRRKITQYYWQALKDCGAGMPFYWTDNEPGIQPAFHIFPLLLPPGMDRLHFMERLRGVGIQTSIHYPPVHLFQYYKENFPGNFINLQQTEKTAEREVTLPLYPGMQDWQVNLVVETVLRTLRSR